MKIPVKNLTYEEVLALPKPAHVMPKKPNFLLSTAVRLFSIGELLKTHFTYTEDDSFRKLKPPYLILMNHSCFLDLKIVYKIFYPQPFNIVCTSDGFVGKEKLMRNLGCIPTQKFVSDVSLIHDIDYSLHKLGTSVLMYPEASYSFDGTATPLPSGLFKLLRKLDVPVVMITTHGAFQHDPLYNCLQQRKVKVSADVTCLFTKEEVETLPDSEMSDRLLSAFSFDNFAWQAENHVAVNEPFRADGLDRILYRCPNCSSEGEMVGLGTTIRCHSCQSRIAFNPIGHLVAMTGKTRFASVPAWFRWEREVVRKELEEGRYRLDTKVRIGMIVDYNALYMVGEGRLVHDVNGFVLTGCDGKLVYKQRPLASYGLYSDYYWYEIGDVICIGSGKALYYCFPEKKGVAAKTRLATEELYKLKYAAARH